MTDERTGTRRGLGQGFALIAVVAYATVNALLRFVAGDVDAFVGSLVRQLPLLVISACALIILRPHVLRRRSPAFLGARSIGILLVSGTISFVLGNVVLFRALDLGGLVVASAGAQAGMAVGGALLSFLVLREPPTAPQLWGLGIVVVGLVVFVLPALGGSVDASWGVGVLLSLLAGLCYTVANTVARSVQRRPKTFVTTLALTNFGGTTLLVIIVLVSFGADIPLIMRELGEGRGLILLGAGLVNAVALGSITLAVRYTTVTVVSTTQSLVLVIGVFVGWLGFGEVMTAATFIGAGIILLGVLVTQFPSRREPRPASTAEPAAAAKR